MKSLRGQRGFTLIEILVSISVTTIMLAGLTMAATSYFSRDSQEQQRMVTQQRMHLAGSVINSDIRQAAYVYPNPVIAANLITAGVRLPGGTTPRLAMLVPNQDGNSDLEDNRFILVVYATGPIPDVAPFNAIKSLRGGVIYRWYSQPDFFDPRTQRQGVDGAGNTPGTLSGNLITYGGPADDVLPSILTGNVNVSDDPKIFNMSTPAERFGPQNSAVGVNLMITAYISGADADNLSGASAVSSYLQTRNLGLPPTPIPGVGASSVGSDSCVSSPAGCTSTFSGGGGDD